MGNGGALPGGRRAAPDLHRALRARDQGQGAGQVRGVGRRRSAAGPSRRSPGCSRTPSAASTTSSHPCRSRPRAWFPRPRPPMPSLASGEGAALLERFRRYLRDHRQPVTRQRDLVAQVVLLSDDHPSVDGIRRALKERGEHVGTATVYRTLEVLVQSGLVAGPRFRRRVQAVRADAGAGRPRAPHLRALRPGRRVPERAARADAAGHRRRARLPAPAPPGRDLRRLPRVPPAGAGRRCERARHARACSSRSRRDCLSFLSPCVLPLVPSYIGFLTGMSLAGGERAGAASALVHALLFVLGFSLVFILLGASATALGARAQLLPAMAAADRRGADHRVRPGLSGRDQGRLSDPGAPGPDGAEAGGYLGSVAGGHGIRRGMDALHRARCSARSSAWPPPRHDLTRGTAAAGRLFGGSGGAVSARGRGARVVSRAGSSGSGGICRGSCG